MLTQNDTTALAVRLFENKTYGTTYGKGLYRRALYNGTIDIKTPVVKYIIDLFPYQEWAHQARSDAQMVTLESITEDSNVLFSWIQRYDPLTKKKTLVNGVCIFGLADKTLQVVIEDEAMAVADGWALDVRSCRVARGSNRSPQLLATNTDLEQWA